MNTPSLEQLVTLEREAVEALESMAAVRERARERIAELRTACIARPRAMHAR